MYTQAFRVAVGEEELLPEQVPTSDTPSESSFLDPAVTGVYVYVYVFVCVGGGAGGGGDAWGYEFHARAHTYMQMLAGRCQWCLYVCVYAYAYIRMIYVCVYAYAYIRMIYVHADVGWKVSMVLIRIHIQAET